MFKLYGLITNCSTHRGALREFVCSHHLHVQVLALRLPPGFDQPLEHLRKRKRRCKKPRQIRLPESNVNEQVVPLVRKL